jgi:hypothetical protein
MNFATISADIISYTSLPELEKRSLESGIRNLLSGLSERFREQNFYGRLVMGDYIECAMDDPRYSLRIALLLKTFIKSFDLNVNKRDRSRLKYFFEHGLRLAVAVAPLAKIDAGKDLIDGEAIYLSGRAIKDLSTSDKKKIVIKNTMFFRSTDKGLEERYDTIFSLLDTIISKCSAKQCEVVYYKLLSFTEKEIAKQLNKYQSTISQHSTAAGWLSIEKAVDFYERNVS